MPGERTGIFSCAYAVTAVSSASTKGPAIASRLRPMARNLISILPERQVEPPLETELGRRRSGNDPRHAVIPQPRGAAEHKGVARFEQQRLDRIAPLQPPEQEPGGIAQRDRHDGEPGVDRRTTFVLVLVQSHPAFGVVV